MKRVSLLLVAATMLAFASSLASGQDEPKMPARPSSNSLAAHSSQAPLINPRGIGKVDKELLRNSSIGPISLPKVPIEPKADIDIGTAQRLALVRARHIWGGNPIVGSVIPVYDGVGHLTAYDVDIDLNGQSWKPYTVVASDWQRILRDQDSKPRHFHLSEGSEANPPTIVPEHAYASLTISATFDVYPVESARRGVSNFYASAWVAEGIASEVFGDQSPNLEKVVDLGPWERAYLFKSQGRTIVVEGQEPWQWYEGEEYSQASTRTLSSRMSELDVLSRSQGSAIQTFIEKARLENQKAVDGIIHEPMTPLKVTYIPGYDTQMEPFEWHYGCSPTAGAMVLNYWENSGIGYQKLNYYFFEEWDRIDNPPYGDYDCHVATLQSELRALMNTDDAGITDVANIYPAMQGYANAQGYSFSGGRNWIGNWFDWYWDDIKSEIDAGFPFVFSYGPLLEAGHSSTAIGYDSKTGDVMVYNTYLTSGNIPTRVNHERGITDWTAGAAPRPGGRTEHGITLRNLEGYQDFGKCGSQDELKGDTDTYILWYNFNHPADHVNLYYSTDGGNHWKFISAAPDSRMYSWHVPNIVSSTCRVLIQQCDRSGNVLGSDGSYGDFAIRATYPITVRTNPSNLKFRVDGKWYQETTVFTWDIGSEHSIGTQSTQPLGQGSRGVWTNWSDGGDITHNVVVTGTRSFMANFVKQFHLSVTAIEGGEAGGSVSPASAYYDSGQVVTISASANAGYSFEGWKGYGNGSYTGANNPATVTMNEKITEKAVFTMNPILVAVTVQANLPGTSFTVDGVSFTAAQSFSWTSGSSHTIATTSPQASGPGAQWVCTGWSDGGTLSHSIAPTSSTTYTANFTQQYYLTMNADPGGAVMPSSGWYNSGQSVSIRASSNFIAWTGTGSGSYTGSNNPATVIMNEPITESASFTGAGWVSQESGTTKSLHSVSFTDANTGTVVGDYGTILRTTDGGLTWIGQAAGTTNDLYGVCFTGAKTGTVVGGKPYSGTGTILRTTDEGTTWTNQGNFTEFDVNAVSFIDANTGFATTEYWEPTILHTTDGGTTWEHQKNVPAPGETFFYGVSCTDPMTATAVGGPYGIIVRTEDGGSTWYREELGSGPGYSPFDGTLYAVCYTDAYTGTVVGEASWIGVPARGGVIFRTENGGGSWVPQAVAAEELNGKYLHGVSFTDANTGTVVGKMGTILRTTDGGGSWVWQASGTTSDLHGISFTDANTGTAVGDNGTIVRTYSGGAVLPKQGEKPMSQLPTKFSLIGNYPNPFNPSTTIRYELPKSSMVTLSVYDMLGRQVSVLVNGSMDAGVHEVMYVAGRLSSGVYIYRLQAGEFVQSMKLTVVK